MPASNATRPARRRLASWAVAGCLLLAIGVVYGQTLWFDFVTYDDGLFVTANPAVQAGLTRSSVYWAFTNGPLGEFYPLAMLSHMLDCQLFGLRAGGHHLTNVLLHAGAAVGLFLVWRNMTGEFWPSALVAAIFAVHPQHVENVAWIAERRDVLSGLLFVLTLAAYLGYVHHNRGVGWYLLVVLCLSLGLLAKPMLVTVPPLLLLLDYWPLRRFGAAVDLPQAMAGAPRQTFWQLVVEKLPLVAITLASCAATLSTHPQSTIPVLLTWSDRLANVPVSLVTYLVQFFYPIGLANFYPYPAAGNPAWQVAGSTLVLAAITAAAIAWRKRRPYLVVGWFWFLGMLVPVLGLVTVADHAMADRYMYLPSIGLSVAVVWGLARIAAGWQLGRFWLAGAAALAIGILTSLAVRQTTYWCNELTLWQHASETTEDNRKVELGLAGALDRAGRLDEAIEHYRRAASWFAWGELLSDLGYALARQGRLDEAEVELRRAVQLDPRSAQAQTNLAMVLDQRGQVDEAADCYRHAIELNDALPALQLRLANLLLKQGKLAAAIPYFQRVIELDPSSVIPHYGLAAIYVDRGETDAAIAEYRAVLQIAPDDALARQTLGQLLESRSPKLRP